MTPKWTPEAFVSWARDVFGEYRPAMKQEVLSWLRPHDEYFIAALRDVALRDHPSVYKVPPGVHELEGWRIEAGKRGRESQLKRLPVETLPDPLTDKEREAVNKMMRDLAAYRKVKKGRQEDVG